MLGGTATNPSAIRALDRLRQASESTGEADGHAAVALADIAEYIEVVRGNGPSSGSLDTVATTTRLGARYDPAAEWRDDPDDF